MAAVSDERAAPPSSQPQNDHSEEQQQGLQFSGLLDDETEALEATEDEFVKQLEQGLESMLADVETDPESRRNFEAIMAEVSKYSDGTELEESNLNENATRSQTKDSLQDAIAKTMERMKESGEKVDQQIADGGTDGLGTGDGFDDDVFLAAMMKQLEQAAAGEGDESEQGTDENLMSTLASVMDQLASKSILYEPIKGLDEFYPAWLESKRSTIEAEEFARHEALSKIVRGMRLRFERPSYNDANSDDQQFILENLHNMGEYGLVPAEFFDEYLGQITENSSGLLGSDAGCPMQ